MATIQRQIVDPNTVFEFTVQVLSALIGELRKRGFDAESFADHLTQDDVLPARDLDAEESVRWLVQMYGRTLRDSLDKVPNEPPSP